MMTQATQTHEVDSAAALEGGHCIWNRRTLCVVCRGDQGALLGAAHQWNAANKASFVVVPTAHIMRCAGCGGEQRAFVAATGSAEQAADLVCDRCGQPPTLMADENHDG